MELAGNVPTQGELVEIMLQQPVWAVVGATARRDKFGFKIYDFLKRHGYRVYAVNPNVQEIEGEKCYAHITELPEKPAVVNMVIAPRLAEPVLQQCQQLHISYVWFQPGAGSAQTLDECRRLGLTAVSDVCVMAKIRARHATI